MYVGFAGLMLGAVIDSCMPNVIACTVWVSQWTDAVISVGGHGEPDLGGDRQHPQVRYQYRDIYT